MSYFVSMPLGVVVAREDIDSQWQDHVWRPVGVLPGAPEIDGWKELKPEPSASYRYFSRLAIGPVPAGSSSVSRKATRACFS